MVKLNKKSIKSIVKVLLTLTALYVVFSKVDFSQVQSIIINANLWYLLLALLFFNFSKILSSIRLNIYFRHIAVKISEIYALKLYYIGMFYNLFLPGGIGGDGYKIYLLKKSHEVKVSKLINITLLDRLSGLIPLLFFAGLLFIASEFYSHYPWLDYVIIIGVVLIFPLFYVLNLLMFKNYISLFFKTTFLGSIVQLLQLVSAFFIVYAIGYESNLLIFLTLFLLSSVVAVLPISIGGIGVRELTFVYGLTLLELEAGGGVAFSLLFFLITALSSFVGIFLNEERQ
ncbi:flippase-like domain-containing protein [bacterium]|nr:flippase-like domain-containing protein [bacterium]MBU1959326.1 flippase-like domain-containing protein [bacterium]